MINEILMLLSSWSEEYFALSLFSVLIAGVIFVISRVLCAVNPWVLQWRRYWLLSFTLAILALGIGWLPQSWINQTVISDWSFSLTSSVFFDSSDINAINVNASSHFPYENILKILWMLIGISVFLALLGRTIRRFYCISRILSSADDLSFPKKLNKEEKETLAFLNQSIVAQHRNVSFKLTNQMHSPFAVQWIRSYVVLTKTALQKLNREELLLLIEHELVHLKRKDSLWIQLTELARAAFWFNPFLTQIVRHMNDAIEMSCDATVLHNQRNLRRTYATAMVKVLRESAIRDANQGIAAFSSSSNRRIKMRIERIMNPSGRRIKRLSQQLITGCLALVSSTVAFSMYPSDGRQAFSSESNMVLPIENARLTSSFGDTNKRKRKHKGIDLAAAKGTPIVAAATGRVIEATTHLSGAKNYGTVIILDHGNGLHTLYSHLSVMDVKVGQVVAQGQQIGRVGMTGKTTGPHVHFEVRQSGEVVNPEQFVRL